MALKRGFKAEANNLARELRSELGIGARGKLCPWELAKYLHIPILKLSDLSGAIPEEIGFLMNDGRELFSAVSVSVGLKRTILHNDANPPSRQASDIAHELSHAILLHPPSPPFNDSGDRCFDKDVEDEANWLGYALLISEEAAIHIVKSGWSEAAAAKAYAVSKDVIRMRINVTGARRRVKHKTR